MRAGTVTVEILPNLDTVFRECGELHTEVQHAGPQLCQKWWWVGGGPNSSMEFTLGKCGQQIFFKVKEAGSEHQKVIVGEQRSCDQAKGLVRDG